MEYTIQCDTSLKTPNYNTSHNNIKIALIQCDSNWQTEIEIANCLGAILKQEQLTTCNTVELARSRIHVNLYTLQPKQLHTHRAPQHRPAYNTYHRHT